MDWKQNFEPSVLKEGYGLFENGFLHDLKKSGTHYQGLVYDPWRRRDMLVEADIEEGSIERLACSCPQSREGFCPHEAAVLFGIEHALPEEDSSHPHQPERNFHSPAGAPPKPHFHPTPKPDRNENSEKSFTFQEFLEHLAKEKDQRKKHTSPAPENPEPHVPSSLKQGRADSLFEDEEDFIAQAFPFQQAPASKSGPQPDAELQPDFFQQPAPAPEPEKRLEAKAKPKSEPVHPVPFAHTAPVHHSPCVHPDGSLQKEGSGAPFSSSLSEQKPEKGPAAPDGGASAPFDSSQAASSRGRGSLLGLIDSLSEKQIRQFLLQEARSNPSFRLRLELEFLKEVPAELLDTYYSGLDTLLYSHQDASGLIPREGEHQLLEVVNAWLASRIDLLLEHDFDAEAFSLIEYAFMALNDLRFENPQQSAETLLEMLAARLAETAGHKDEALNASIFTWLEMELKNPRLSRSLKHSLLQVLDSAFSSERYIQARLALLEDMLKEETEHRPDSRLDSSLRNQIIRQIFTLFSSTDQYPGEKEAFEKEMENSSLWQDLKIQKAIALDDLETARILLTESLRSVPSGSLEAAVRMRRLATLLKEEGRLPEARAVLKSLMSRNAHLVPADLYMYRDMVDEAEFLSAMHTLHSFVSPLVLGEVYASGGYEEALMDLIEERSDLLLLEQYEERLAARFASRMIALWLEEARTKAASSNSRSYPAAIYALQKAAALPQGEPRAQSMADTLRQSWPHKRSLLHRLEEAGFGEKQDSPVDPQKPEQDKGKETPEKTA